MAAQVSVILDFVLPFFSDIHGFASFTFTSGIVLKSFDILQ